MKELYRTGEGVHGTEKQARWRRARESAKTRVLPSVYAWHTTKPALKN